MHQFTPREIVSELDRYIIGQQAAKQAVAIALRNRWRRQQVASPMREEIYPKNILMIGPTGIGKTEIARRLAKLANAPFIKVEATKFTEVGYVGRDVESIIRDLADLAVKMTMDQFKQRVHQGAQELAEDRVLELLLPRPVGASASNPMTWLGQLSGESAPPGKSSGPSGHDDSATRQKMRKMLREGLLNDREVEVEVRDNRGPSLEILAPQGMEGVNLNEVIGNIFGGKTRKRRVTVAEALRLLTDEEAGKLVDRERVQKEAIEQVEQSGIVFIDELDKVCSRGDLARGGADISREGVQRDLLPLVEGTTVSTKYGMVRTDHILFVASGAFQLAKPSDLLPELQGRLPIRVELDSLTVEDFVRILTEPENALTKQYTALMATEGVTLEFHGDGIRALADIAAQVNQTAENIGARRLHTVLEKMLDQISFTAPEHHGETVVITAEYVHQQLHDLAGNEDLSRYIL